MNILILHRIPYHKIDYHRGIDHERHDVTYVGVAATLATIPAELRARRIERPGVNRTADEVIAWLTDEPTLRYDRVISLSEYELADAARVRAHLGLAGASPSDVERVRDKVVMKRAAEAAGLRVPRFLPLQAFLARDAEVSAPWRGKTVLKPLDGASSEDLVIFETAREAHRAITEGRSGVKRLDGERPQLKRFEVEEFVEGPILHIDGLVGDGRLIACVTSRYVGTCAGYARGVPFGSVQIDDDDGRTAWTERVLAAVGIASGSFHLEAIEHDGELVFLEVAHRVGGADVVATFELATGLHLPSLELMLIVGDGDVRALTCGHRRSEMRFGWFVVPGHHLRATHARLDGAERFTSSPLMLRWHQLDASRPLPRTITYQAHEVPAAGIVRGQSGEQLSAFLRTMFDTLRLEPIVTPTAAAARETVTA